jgi:tetratricopeptide (TPR) repeat protein
LVQQLGDPDQARRANAAAALVKLGPVAVPALARQRNSPNAPVAEEVRRILSDLAASGESSDGLALSAIAVGPQPRLGEAAAIWITLRNTSAVDVPVLLNFWRLYVVPLGKEKSLTQNGGAFITEANYTKLHFSVIPAGQRISRLMYAETAAGVENGEQSRVVLHVPLYDQALPERIKTFLANGTTLMSRPIAWQEVGNRQQLNPEAAKLFDDYCSFTKPDAEQKLAHSALFAEALRYGFSRSKPLWRNCAFSLCCQYAVTALEPELLDYCELYGPGLRPSTWPEEILGFASALPPERRRTFLPAVAQRCIDNWTRVHNLAVALCNAEVREDRLAGVEVFDLLRKHGDSRPETAEYVASEKQALALEQDPKGYLAWVREKAKAEKERTVHRLLLACLERDAAAVKELGRGATASDCNSAAWTLATRAPEGIGNADAAVDLALQAVNAVQKDSEDYPEFLDTLAAAHAAKGDYKSAIQRESEALEHLNADSTKRSHFARRLVRYTALQASGAGPSRLCDPFQSGNTKALEVLLQRLKTEKDESVAQAIKFFLRSHYAADTAVRKALMDVPPDVQQP